MQEINTNLLEEKLMEIGINYIKTIEKSDSSELRICSVCGCHKRGITDLSTMKFKCACCIAKEHYDELHKEAEEKLNEEMKQIFGERK